MKNRVKTMWATIGCQIQSVSNRKLPSNQFLVLFNACILFVAVSCSMGPDVKDADRIDPGSIEIGPRIPLIHLSLLPANVTLDRVILYTDKGALTTGTAIVEIRDSTGTLVLGSSVLPASAIANGGAWTTFPFSPAISLGRGSKYRIYLTRSDAHNYTAQNYIFWRTSSGGVDAYSNGINDVYPSWTLDYAFKTYINGGLDQQQTSYNYGFFTSSGMYRWQEFLADYPKVSLNRIDLNLTTGPSTTGMFIIQIRSGNGLKIIKQFDFVTSAIMPGTLWSEFSFPGVSLYRDELYRIYVTRSDAHNYTTGNYIFWRTSSGGVNAYPDGINDVYPSWTLDYAFRTYTAGGLDQQQNSYNYGFFTSSGIYRWQEFIPRLQ